MISYQKAIKRKRLESVINFIDDDGEFGHSTRQPVFRFYGASFSNRATAANQLPQSIQDIVDTQLFKVVGEFKLYKPSFVIDSSETRMMFNIPRGSDFRFNANLSSFNVSHNVTLAVILFARITNAHVIPEEMIHLDVGLLSSTKAVKLNKLEVSHLEEIVFVNHTIIEG